MLSGTGGMELFGRMHGEKTFECLRRRFSFVFMVISSVDGGKR